MKEINAFKVIYMNTRILITGANGQLGTVLTKSLQEKFGIENIIASDLIKKIDFKGVFEVVDATNFNRVQQVVVKYKVTQIYHLAAILSAAGEQNPLKTWDINMKTWFTILEVARLHQLDKVFYPSSIAVFGPSANQDNTANNSFLDPTTVYGVSKVAGENWGNYYYLKYGLDVRSIRYPGIIGYQSNPGGGTTDYAVDIFHKATLEEPFHCFLDKSTVLPMIFMDDVVRATIEIMEAPKESIKNRTSYNISGVSFSPADIVQEIVKVFPNFKAMYQPDFRQEIASKWPNTIDDQAAKEDWGWIPKYNLEMITTVMIQKLKDLYQLKSA